MGKKQWLSESLKKLYQLLRRFKKYVLSSKWRQLIAIIGFAEFLFYLRCKYLIYYVNNFIPVTIVQPPFDHKRIETIRKYGRIYNDYNKGSRIKFIQETFNNSPLNEIKKENIKKFITWGYFVKYDDEIKSKLSIKEIEWRDKFISDTIENLEKEINYKFEEGYNPKINTLSNTDENKPIKSCYHPFMIYLFIWLFPKQFANFIFSYYLKFEYKYIDGLKVWYRLSDNEKEPLLMFGGVSIANPLQCISFMNQMIKKYKNNKNLFVIEIPWSELSIHHFIPFCGYINNKLPLSMIQITDILFQIENNMILNNYNNNNHEKKLKLEWSLIGESFGTFICSAIYQRIKDNDLGIIPRLILVDSPTLCMTDPKLGRLQGTVERDWKKWLFQLLVSQELMIATLGSRYMHWFQFCLYPHDLINDGCNKSHIIVSGTKDHIIPFKTIKKGIDEANKLCFKKNKKIKHIIMEGIPHGIWLIHPKYQRDVIQIL